MNRTSNGSDSAIHGVKRCRGGGWGADNSDVETVAQPADAPAQEPGGVRSRPRTARLVALGAGLALALGVVGVQAAQARPARDAFALLAGGADGRVAMPADIGYPVSTGRTPPVPSRGAHQAVRIWGYDDGLTRASVSQYVFGYRTVPGAIASVSWRNPVATMAEVSWGDPVDVALPDTGADAAVAYGFGCAAGQCREYLWWGRYGQYLVVTTYVADDLGPGATEQAFDALVRTVDHAVREGLAG